MTFPGFTTADFDAYLGRKWTSHVFNRERLAVKEKLLALGRAVGALDADGGAPLTCDADAEHPTLWNQRRVCEQRLAFTRDAGARQEVEKLNDRGRTIAALVEDPTPARKHALLALTIDQHGIEVALRLHAHARVDRDNLRRRAADYLQREKLLAALRALPDGFAVGWDDAARPVAAVDDAALAALVASEACDGWFAVARRRDRSDELLARPAFADVARAELHALLPIWRFCAWSPQNDYIGATAALRASATQARTRGLGKGDAVRIRSGLLAGKAGVVQAVEPKGSLRVLVGKMSVKLEGKDVEPAAT